MRAVLIYVRFDLKHIQDTLSHIQKIQAMLLQVVREVMSQKNFQ
jgi:hypothetical protein